ncbi:hypothetical protein [Cognatishimia maritima]|uniref:Uncharacterized protein n=1 Tax=Cognatishimia maritima TaxID=870908 RepID=A0A1M5JHG0_9RHOB|nr:hypothetical protein [Cognatishimia maritima]SHG39700.1 hypothetical protein SAMN04488044_0654 [Cognatishimia maritima]
MDILGRDRETECYHVKIDVDGRAVSALVPERLGAGHRFIGARPTHQSAYTWIAENQTKIEAAIAILARGSGRPKAPFDQITLIKER